VVAKQGENMISQRDTTKGEAYVQTKANLEQTGYAVLNIAERTNNKAVIEFLSEVLAKLPRDEFYLAVLGLFKRGKSTFINALLGSQILPTGVVPVTSVITRIRYARTSGARITFVDGSSKETMIGDLSEYVTEAGNPNNIKKVTIADVFLPAEILRSGLVLIDTPGVGSTCLNGTQTTFQFLDRIDFAVFVLAVDPPVGQQEVQLLSTLSEKSSKILFVLNKKDYVDAEALAESVKYCQKVISEHIGQNTEATIAILPVSAKLALEGRLRGSSEQVRSSGIVTFEKVLQESLIEKKEGLMLGSAKNKIEKSVSDLMTYIQLEISSLTMPLENLKNLLLEFEQYLNNVEVKKRELFYVIQGRAKEIVDALDKDLSVFKREKEKELIEQVEAFAIEKLNDKNLNSKKVTSAVDEFLRKALITTYTKFIEEEDSKLQLRFQELVKEVDAQTNTLVGNVKEKAAKLFGFQIENVNFNSSLAFETRFYYHLDPVFTTSITFSGGEIAELLPKFLFKGVLKKKLAERVISEFDKNGGRIRYDYFVTRLDRGVLRLKQDIDHALESSTESVRQAVHEAEQLQVKGQEEVSKKLSELKMMQNQLLKIRGELTNT